MAARATAAIASKASSRPSARSTYDGSRVAELHAALASELSDPRAYLSTSRRSFFHALQTLWADARAADRRRREGAPAMAAE